MDYDKELKNLDGRYARLSFYTESHNSMMIRVSSKAEKYVYVYMNFVTSIHLPSIDWEPCEIRVAFDEDGVCTLTDEKSGASVVGNLVYVGPENIREINNL